MHSVNEHHPLITHVDAFRTKRAPHLMAFAVGKGAVRNRENLNTVCVEIKLDRSTITITCIK